MQLYLVLSSSLTRKTSRIDGLCAATPTLRHLVHSAVHVEQQSNILDLHHTCVDTSEHLSLLIWLCVLQGPELRPGFVSGTGDVAVLSSSCVDACSCC